MSVCQSALVRGCKTRPIVLIAGSVAHSNASIIKLGALLAKKKQEDQAPDLPLRENSTTMATLSPNFGYVAATAAASYFVHHIYMTSKVHNARRKYNIEYPHLYATAENCSNEADRKVFNCMQRAHQNSLENQPILLALLTISGLQYPLTAASLGAAALVGRVGYFEGYASGDPEKRENLLYTAGMLAMLGLGATTIKVAVDLISKALQKA